MHPNGNDCGLFAAACAIATGPGQAPKEPFFDVKQIRSHLNLRVNELSHGGKETMVRRFNHEGLRQLQNSLVTDEDLHSGKETW